MADNNKKLYEAIRDVITQQGKYIIKDVRLVNILSDTFAFSDMPAAKPILRDILRSGYGAALFDLGDSGIGWQLKMQVFANNLANKHGYRRDIVDYIFNCLAYGMGWIDTVADFSESAQQAQQPTSNDYISSGGKITDLNTELKKAKDKYLRVLEEGIVIPDKGCGYYPALVVNQLDFLSERIKMLSDALHTEDTQWCIDKKQEVLNRYYKDVSGLKKKSIAKIAIPAAAVLIGIGFGTAYLSASGEREQFQQSISQGDKLYEAGSYLPAISSYKDAYTKYDAFNESSYKADAFSKITEATDKLIGEAESNPEKLLEAKKALISEQTMELSENDMTIVNEKLTKINNKITVTVNNGKNSLVLNISGNGGKLDTEGKSLLQQLLKLSPDDYWLNFLKKKEL